MTDCCTMLPTMAQMCACAGHSVQTQSVSCERARIVITVVAVMLRRGVLVYGPGKVGSVMVDDDFQEHK